VNYSSKLIEVSGEKDLKEYKINEECFVKEGISMNLDKYQPKSFLYHKEHGYV